MKDGFLKVGVASVDVEVANPIHNKEKVMEVIKKADKNGVKLLVFPNLFLLRTLVMIFFYKRRYLMRQRISFLLF